MLYSEDARVIAKRHTSQLLGMLRGYISNKDLLEPVTQPTNSATMVPSNSGFQRIEGIEQSATTQNCQYATSDKDLLNISQLQKYRQQSGPICTVGEVLFHKNGTLGILIEQVQYLVRMSLIFRSYLPPHLHDHAVLIRLDAAEWIVHTESSSWATRLRYSLYNMQETLGRHLGISLPKPHIRIISSAALLDSILRTQLRLNKSSTEILGMAACDQSG